MAARQKKGMVFIGERKRSKALAFIRPGTGKVRINSSPIDIIENGMVKLMLEEPLVLAGDVAKALDIDVTVKGGGAIGRAEAIRQAIASGIVKFTKDKKLRSLFDSYDRNMLVADPRRTEPHKPSRSSAGPRRHKQRSKR